MRVSISTIKKNKVYLILCSENGVTREQFSEAVQNYFLVNYPGIPYCFYIDTYDATLAMVVIPDVNQDHEAPQQNIDI